MPGQCITFQGGAAPKFSPYSPPYFPPFASIRHRPLAVAGGPVAF